MPRFGLKVTMGIVIVLSILAIPIVQAARADADATVLGERVLARLRAEPAQTWFQFMDRTPPVDQGTELDPTFARIATEEGRNLLRTGEIAQLSVVDITRSEHGTESVAAVNHVMKLRRVEPAGSEWRTEDGRLARRITAEATVALAGRGERRVRYFVIMDLSAVERARSLRTIAIVVAIALAGIAGLAGVWNGMARRKTYESATAPVA